MAVNRFEIEQKLIFAKLSEKQMKSFQSWELLIDTRLEKIKLEDFRSGNPLLSLAVMGTLDLLVLELLVSVYESNGWRIKIFSSRDWTSTSIPAKLNQTLSIYASGAQNNEAINYY